MKFWRAVLRPTDRRIDESWSLTLGRRPAGKRMDLQPERRREPSVLNIALVSQRIHLVLVGPEDILVAPREVRVHLARQEGVF